MFRDLLRKNKQLSQDECSDVLENETRGVLSVNGDNGYPYCTPMNYFYNKEDGCIYFHCGKSGHRLDSLKKDNKVSFCVYNKGEKDERDWAYNVKSVVIFGRIEMTDNMNMIVDIITKLSLKFTSDTDYIANEIENYASETILLKLIPEHICGKRIKESVMVRKIELCGRVVKYDFEYKPVKNINLRIKHDGSVHVSSSRFTAIETVESFMKSKADFIINAIDKYTVEKQDSKIQYFTEYELKILIMSLCKNAYPYYRDKGIAMPTVKFRKMVSMWGNCYPNKGVLTFNTNLIYAPSDCVEYVVWHEFTHFLEANHSKRFYNELSKVCPGWKYMRLKLKGIALR